MNENSPNSSISSSLSFTPEKPSDLNTLQLTNTQLSSSSLSSDSLFKTQQGKDEKISLSTDDQLILQHVNLYGKKKWNLLTSKINKSVEEIIKRYEFLSSKI